jgi:hypothetical protein
VGGRISGSSTVIGNVVYFSNLGSKTTTGVDAVTGRTVFSFPDGAFTPIIADYHALYLDGYATIYQLLPGAKPKPHAKRRRGVHHARHAAARRHRSHTGRTHSKKRAARTTHNAPRTHAQGQTKKKA